MRWWDGTPAGRVVNRLSSDVYAADNSLPFQANIALASLYNLFGSLVLTLYALPLFAPAAVIAAVLYYFIQVELIRFLYTTELSSLYPIGILGERRVYLVPAKIRDNRISL